MYKNNSEHIFDKTVAPTPFQELKQFVIIFIVHATLDNSVKTSIFIVVKAVCEFREMTCLTFHITLSTRGKQGRDIQHDRFRSEE